MKQTDWRNPAKINPALPSHYRLILLRKTAILYNSFHSSDFGDIYTNLTRDLPVRNASEKLFINSTKMEFRASPINWRWPKTDGISIFISLPLFLTHLWGCLGKGNPPPPMRHHFNNLSPEAEPSASYNKTRQFILPVKRYGSWERRGNCKSQY